jgi:hypothetical protein
VRDFVNTHLPGGCVGRRENAKYPPQSPDLTPLNSSLWGSLSLSACDR